MRITKARQFFLTLTAIAGVLMFSFSVADAQSKNKFRVAWSIYAGWMPWDYAEYSGILAKHAKANGITIELTRFAYVPSVEAYVAKQVDAVAVTNMEALDMPAASGIDTTAIITGDYSNGNDAVETRDNLGLGDLRGKKVYLAEGSVSHYLLNRCLELKSKLTEKDVQLVNISEDDINAGVLANKSVKVWVTWNPFVMQTAQEPGVKLPCTSADIPGEIQDLMVVRTDVLKANPVLGRALVGAWYEVMSVMTKRGDPVTTAALNYMAKSSASTLTEFQAQLQTTAMFYTPKSAVDYTESVEIKQKMNFVRQFCFTHGLLGQNVKSADVVGIQYPDGSIQGDPKNVKLRYDSSYMRLAMDGKLTVR